MARYYGVVGFSNPTEVSPGIWEDVITERSYFGTVTKDVAKWKASENLHNDFSVANVIDILADGYAFDNISAIRYIHWSGADWSIADVEISRPRLTIRLGGLYHGPKPSP